MAKRVAIIGSGIAGMGCAWHLHNAGYDITLYENDTRIGGHSNTVSGNTHPDVDTGFIVFNEWTYPNLIALFDHLGLETEKSDMSFGVSAEHGAFEYSSSAMFADRRNLLSPRFWDMLMDILRFYRNAPKAQNTDISLGAFLDQGGYGQTFINHHMIPMGAAIWSMGMEEMRGFPLQSFVRFFINHGLMKIINRPQWYTVTGGSREYIKKLIAPFAGRIHTGVNVTKIDRSEGIMLRFLDAEEARFDHLVLACHSDQALALLGDAASEAERDVLSAIPYSPNTAYLHSDTSLMPKNKKAWAAWNVLCEENKQNRPVTLTYWMNILQPFIGEEELFVTLNPDKEPQDVLAKIDYAHPCYTEAAIKAQTRLHSIEGAQNTWFCGAWCGYGFHEDGLTSGLSVAEMISSTSRPWVVTEKSNATFNIKGGKT